jgi:hypothetical protein
MFAVCAWTQIAVFLTNKISKACKYYFVYNYMGAKFFVGLHGDKTYYY